MASNFDFLKNIDSELFEIIEEAQNLFRSEYFNQCVIQVRIYAEKMAKKTLGEANSSGTFDDILNNLKDKIQTVEEKEFIEDLFFIKKQGNACAHGEITKASDALEVLKRAFEAGISYSRFKTKNEKTLAKISKLLFDETLLITTKPKENSLIEKYLERAIPSSKAIESKEQIREALLNDKQGEFLSKTAKTVDDYEIGNFEGFKDKYSLSDPSQYKEENKQKKGRKKTQDPKKAEIKEKIKKAKKNLKENINKVEKPKKNTVKKTNSKSSKKLNLKIEKYEKIEIGAVKAAIFLIFVLISLYLLTKLIF